MRGYLISVPPHYLATGCQVCISRYGKLPECGGVKFFQRGVWVCVVCLCLCLYVYVCVSMSVYQGKKIINLFTCIYLPVSDSLR